MVYHDLCSSPEALSLGRDSPVQCGSTCPARGPGCPGTVPVTVTRGTPRAQGMTPSRSRNPDSERPLLEYKSRNVL
eukprot:61615-Rhodomonas_salina.1